MTADVPTPGWLPPATHAADPLDGVLAWSPELLTLFRRYYGTIREDRLLDAQLLELVRIRIAQVHGCAAEAAIRDPGAGVDDAQLAALPRWRGSDLFDPAQRAALEYAELIPFQHHFIEEHHVAAVKAHLDDPAFVAFGIALSLFDAVSRLRMAFGLSDAADATIAGHA